MRKGKEREDGELKDRDFFEEHEKLKQLKSNSSPFATDVSLTTSTAQPASSQLQPTSKTAYQQPSRVPMDTLVDSLRHLGLDPRPLEALKSYAKQLDERERQLAAEIEERQRTLEVVRKARELLRKLGV